MKIRHIYDGRVYNYGSTKIWKKKETTVQLDVLRNASVTLLNMPAHLKHGRQTYKWQESDHNAYASDSKFGLTLRKDTFLNLPYLSLVKIQF